MTDEDILRMAREAGGTWEYRRTFPVACVMHDDELIKFANLVAARAAIEQAQAPRQWQGLTKEEVDDWQLPDRPTVFEFAQFIEARLKEKNNA